MAASHVAHHCHRHAHRGDHSANFAQANADYWNSAADTVFEYQWVKDLQTQVGNCFLSNLEWAGINPDAKSDDAAKKGKVLDYGCGEGFLSRLLAPYVTKCIGMDIAEAMVAKFNKRAREHGFADDHVIAVQGDITSPAHGTELDDPEYFNFDLIVVSTVLHHMKDSQLAIDRFVERLRPGSGVLVVIDGEVLHEGTGAPAATEPNDEKTIDEVFPQPHPAKHTVAHAGFSKEQFKDLVTNAGCDVADYFLLPEKSVMPMAKDGKSQLFFGKGRRQA